MRDQCRQVLELDRDHVLIVSKNVRERLEQRVVLKLPSQTALRNYGSSR